MNNKQQTTRRDFLKAALYGTVAGAVIVNGPVIVRSTPLSRSIDHMRQATIALQQKINAAKPGDVLTRGMQQSPESIGTAILKQAGRRR